jgi:hypothetical protein
MESVKQEMLRTVMDKKLNLSEKFGMVKVKLSLGLIKYRAMKTYWGVEE